MTSDAGCGQSSDDPQKVDAELKSRITKDAGVQKWFSDYGKKHAK
jgi:hypothetical protein